MVARDVADIGQPDVTLEDVRAFWATPGVDLAADAWVVEETGGEVVASGQLLGDDALIFVHPDACGQGIGSALRELAEERARERGTAVLRQFQPVGNEASVRAADGGRLLAGAALHAHADAARRRARTGAPTACGRSTASATSSRCTQVVEGAMGEVEGHVAESLEVWRAQRILKEGWDPSLWLLLHDEEGLAGAALGERWENGVGYVAELGRRAPRARAGTRPHAAAGAVRGLPRRRADRSAELSVHGANRSAARLYESVGMRASWEAQRWEKALGHD